MSFDTVDLLTGKVFQVTWDLGRRCNYDCSYCPTHRHDNFSSHATLDELKSRVEGIKIGDPLSTTTNTKISNRVKIQAKENIFPHIFST